MQPLYDSNISVIVENRKKATLLFWDDHAARIFDERSFDEVKNPILDLQVLWDYLVVV